MFDSLADLVEHFKKTGIEEVSGSFVYLKQVNPISSVSDPLEGPTCCLFLLCVPLLLFSTVHRRDFALQQRLSLSLMPIHCVFPSPALLRYEGECC